MYNVVRGLPDPMETQHQLDHHHRTHEPQLHWLGHFHGQVSLALVVELWVQRGEGYVHLPARHVPQHEHQAALLHHVWGSDQEAVPAPRYVAQLCIHLLLHEAVYYGASGVELYLRVYFCSDCQECDERAYLGNVGVGGSLSWGGMGLQLSGPYLVPGMKDDQTSPQR